MKFSENVTDIPDDSRGEFSILSGDSIDYWENVCMKVSLNWNGCRDSAV